MKKYIALLMTPLTALAMLLSIAMPISAQAQTETAPALCYTFTKNLGEGRYISTTDAQALTIALINAGTWNTEAPITTYNDAVASAVSGFQEKYATQILTPNGLSYGTGYVGASTRAELNSLYSCSSTSTTTANNTSQSFQCPSGWSCTAPVSTPTPTYSCPTGWTCTPTPNTPVVNSPASSFSATISLDPSSPLSGQTAQTLAVPVLVFDVIPHGTSAQLTNLTVNIATSGSGSVSMAYLYQGSTQVAMAPVSNGVVAFNGISQHMQNPTLIANTYYPFTVKIDTTNANGLTTVASIQSSNVSIMDPSTSPISVNGSVNGYPILIGGNPGSPIVPPTTGSTATESASLSLDASSPLAGPVYQNSSVPILVFDITPNTLADLSNLSVQLSTSGSGSITTAYLSQGGKNIATTTVTGNTAQFNQISVTPMSSNTAYPFMVRVDTTNPQNLIVTASVNSTNARVVDSTGVLINIDGQAVGYPITVTGTSAPSY